MKMGERIAKLRKEKGMSQEKLAEALGLSRQAVAKWETDQSFPSSGNLFKLAEVLGTDVDALLKGELESPPAPSDDFAEVKKDLRKRLLAAGAVAGAFLLYYLLGRLPIGFSGYSVVGWLTESSPLVLPYLYGWSAGLVWFVFLLSLGAVLGKKYRFASAVTAGHFIGYLLGEWFGDRPVEIYLCHSHIGWAVWIVVVLFSVVMGAVWQKKGWPVRSKAFALWAGVLAGGSVVLLLLLRFFA